jgi:hypothetical protein
MKILKKGKLPPSPHYNGTCKNCGAVVECVDEDLLGISNRGKENTCSCPTKNCGNYICLTAIEK